MCGRLTTSIFSLEIEDGDKRLGSLFTEMLNCLSILEDLDKVDQTSEIQVHTNRRETVDALNCYNRSILIISQTKNLKVYK